MLDYTFALLFGAGTVVFFAWDQFNRPSYEGSRELTRLIEILKPARTRRRTVYWRAYAFYAAILLLIYFTLCAYGLLLGPTIGLQVPGYTSESTVAPDDAATGPDVGARVIPASGYDPDSIAELPQVLAQTAGKGAAGNRTPGGACTGFACDPTVPLFISLVMVGLAPSFPMLVKAEKRIRLAAHRLSGIPTRLISGSRRLRMRPIRLRPDDGALLISQQDRRRLVHYDQPARAHLDEPDGFLADIDKIIALRTWVLQEKLPLANPEARADVAEIEAGVRASVDQLIFNLDTLSGFEGEAAQHGNGMSAEQARLAWDVAAKSADLVCGDFCVLLMLYVEHGVLPTRSDAERVGWGVAAPDDDPDFAKQTRAAEELLLDHLDDAARFVERENLGMTLWVRATLTALLIAFVYGMLFGGETAKNVEDSLSGGNRFGLGLQFLISATLIYALALLVSVSWRQSAYQSGAWHNLYTEHWSRWAPQMLTVLLLAGLASLICVVGNSLIATVGAVGIEIVMENRVAVLIGAVQYNGPPALLGATLSVVVIAIIDAWFCKGGIGIVWLRRLPWIAGVVMFLAGFGSRQLMSAAAGQAGTSFGFSCWKPDQSASDTLTACLTSVWTPAISAGVLAGIIGIAVALFIRGTLVHEFPLAPK